MFSVKKAGILVALLLVPVFVFLFLKLFGQNHFALQRFVPERVDSVLVNGKMQYDTVFHKVPDFSLTDQRNTTVSQQALNNGVYVANFFFATCTTVCPRMADQLERVQHKFKTNDRVKIVSYSVNPDQDSVEVLQKYAAAHSAIPGKWFLLTGDKKRIYNLARTGYYLPVGPGDGGKDDFIHSPKLVLVDHHKQIRGFYDGTDPAEVDRLITEINVLLHEYKLDQQK